VEQGETTLREVIQIQTFDGHRKTVLNSSVPLRVSAGRIIGGIAVHEVITERVKAEEELKRAHQELESFSYSVSHDLRAPLRHLDGFAELLLKHARENLNEKARRYATIISDSAKQMGRLIDDLLVFSRMGRQEMLDSPVDLNVLAREAIEIASVQANGRLLNWRIGELPTVRGDPQMLKQVLVNLVSNGVKYTGPTKSADIDIGSWAEETETVCYVRDNGVGFDMQYADKLFGVFQRLHSAKEFEGTGIGLANVRRIIGRHGGRTWAVGAVNAGATFYFSLPSTTKVGCA
jgi:light-regulated signal transduction histidine kinase (bacteriophytochrome)